ncbi:MAG: hypothetical protein KGL39_05300 [Patescibacteria group bacterium]|nr:hypothetical protein [Patescibacteria group bacterium]
MILLLSILSSSAWALNGNNWTGSAPPSTFSGAPANPAATTSSTLVMMGLGGVSTITPVTSGVVMVTICGDSSNATVNDGVKTQIVVGTGTAPVNGAAIVGTAISGVVTTSGGAASALVPVCQVGLGTNLTIGSAYWIDAALAVNGGGTAALSNLTIIAYELP